MADRFSLDSEPAKLADVDGFRVGVAECGLKPEGPDLGVILCEEEGCGTALFSINASRAAPVQVSRPRALAGRLRAVVANSGNANCFTGEQGLEDAREMVALAASGLDVPEEQVLVASVGAAGVPLPMDKLSSGMEAACSQARDSGKGDLAGVIVPVGGTPRMASASGVIDGKPFRVAGVTRGLELADTGMANVFAFIVTDAAVEPEFLAQTVTSARDASFGRLIVDSGVGTNDTLCVLSSGRAGNEPLGDLLSGGIFAEALGEVVASLAFDLAFSASGPTRLIEVQVSGAASDEDAETVARAIAGSALVKLAVHAGRPGWELVLAAAGRSGARVVESRATVRMAGTIVYDRGRPSQTSPDELAEELNSARAAIELDLGLGEGAAGMFTCTLSDGAKPGAGPARDAEDEGAKPSDPSEDGRPAESSAEVARLRAELAEKTEQLDDIEWEHAKELREVKREALEDAASADDIPAEMQKMIEELEAELEKARNSRRITGGSDAPPASEGGDGESRESSEELARLRAELEEKDDQLKDLEWQHAKELREAKRDAAEGDGASSDEITELKAKVEELQGELEEAKAVTPDESNMGLLEKINDLQAELEEAREGGGEEASEELTALREELEKKDETIREMEFEHVKALREARKQAADTEESSGDTDKRVAELEAELEEANTKLEQANAELALKEQLIEQFKSEQAGGGGGDGASTDADARANELAEMLKKANGELALKEQLIEQLKSERPSGDSESEASAEFKAKIKDLEKKLVKKLESEQASGDGGGGGSPDAEKKIKSLEKKLEKANEKLLKRAEKIAELREKIGGS